MALYKVSRTDTDAAIKPGEFIDAFVIAGGTALARYAVAHLPGVTRKNVIAERVDVAAPESASLIGVYFNEASDDPQPSGPVESEGAAPAAW
ncbi:hypothetical protein ACFW5K_19910 [Streptomyces albidoflavus]